MVLIYTPFSGNRLKYVFDYIFGERLCIDYSVTNDPRRYTAEKNAAKISYDTRTTDESLFLYASSSILSETTIEPVMTGEGLFNNSPVLFGHQNKSSALSFDIFAAIFYLLSRYEEYVYKGRDRFGNFDHRQSILYKLNTLDRPVVDEWISIFRNVLNMHFPSLHLKQETPRYILSFDIDVAYEYRNRTPLRTVGGLVKKISTLKWNALKDQAVTLLHKKQDSFDTYRYIEETIDGRALFFLNMGKYGKFDKNPSYKNTVFRRLIRSLQQKHFIGLHPSHASNHSEKLLIQEKEKLEEITGHEIVLSRQHYLKIDMPETFRRLLRNGIKKDFSCGYYTCYGFRAGTCHPFPFFDLLSNEITNLRVYPFAFMDGTFNEVLRLTPGDASLYITQLIATAKEFNGVFIPLWHNSTLSETGIWKGWRTVFEHMLKELDEKKFDLITNIEA